MRMILVAVAMGLLAACATSTPYQPSTDASRYGFTETAIESNRLRITFRGNTLTERETVETYLLYRAAEATVERGFDYFIVANRDVDQNTRLQGTGYRPARFGFDYWYYSARRGWSPWYDPFWDEPMSYREVTRYEAVAEIAMFDGAKPQGDPSAYDAREVMQNLQGRIVRPAAAN